MKLTEKMTTNVGIIHPDDTLQRRGAPGHVAERLRAMAQNVHTLAD